MKRNFLVLIISAGLGSSISFAQLKQQSDPFDRYLTGLKTSHPEAALVRFAGECGVEIKFNPPQYADRPDNSWVQVKDLSEGIHGLETDFFGTVAVWRQTDLVLVEMWTMELDVGSESRNLYCLNKKKITLMESTVWTLPIAEDGKENPGWGYEQKWTLTKPGNLARNFQGFVDSSGQPMPQPRLDLETQRVLNWDPKVRTWDDLELPQALLR